MSLNSDPDSVLIKVESTLIDPETGTTRVVVDFLPWVEPEEEEVAPELIDDGPEF